MNPYFKTAMRRAATIFLAASAVQTAMAVPAKPGVIERHQADGSSVSVMLRGDEHSHFLLSEDGFPLVDVGGLLFFASVDAEGNASPSPFRAVAPAMRDQATREFLASIDPSEAASRMAARAASARKTRMIKRGPGLSSTTFPGKGEQKGLVILVSYSDVDFTLNEPYDYFANLLNQKDFSRSGATGSARDYFIESSDSLFLPTFDVYGPVKLPQPMSYYGGNDRYGNDLNPEMMAVHACQMLDPTVDFSEYDRDGDGLIDNVFVFYAGRGEASGGSANTVWPHSWDVRSATYTPYVFDGVRLGHYACTNEWTDNYPDGIGTFCHEFSHVMGLPDLYATTYTNSFTPGSWNVLDMGPYNNNGRTPPIYSAFERYAMDWMTPEPITGPANLSLPPIAANKAYIIPTASDNEFFLLENRQKTGWDKFIPGHGMLIWHIDYNRSVWDQNVVNNTPSHQYVDIEEADNSPTEYTRAGDSFPGQYNITEFTDDTYPSMKTWSGTRLNLPITDIAETGGMITFKVAGGLEQSIPTEADSVAAETLSHEGFTASWKAVADAEYYELNVYRDANPAKSAAFRAPSAAFVNTGTETSWQVTGLRPDTDYAYTVFVKQKDKGLSAASNEVKFHTQAAPFSSLAPYALPAAEVCDTAFTARWEALDRATDYLLSVGRLTASSCRTDTVSFDKGTSAVPAGWSASTSLTYDDPQFCGESVPSLRLNANGAYIQSPEYSSDIVSLSFWERSPEEGAANQVEVRWYIDGSWIEPTLFDVATAQGGATITISDVPAGARAVRISLLQAEPNNSSLAIDDILVGWDATYTAEPLPLYTDRISDGNLSLRVEGLLPLTHYGYTVTATDGTGRSLPSQTVVVATSPDPYAGIAGIGADNSGKIRTEGLTVVLDGVSAADVRAYDAAGLPARFDAAADGLSLRLTFPTPGVYVVVTPAGAFKAALR